MTKIDEKIEDLQCKGLKIIQNKSLYTFTSASVVLANFLKIKKGERALEIGTGSGVISLLACAKTCAAEIVAFELQEEMASLAQRNVELNNLDGKIKIINAPIQEYKKYFAAEQFDVVFSNPPYMVSSADKSQNKSRDVSRHDDKLKIDELCFYASLALRFGGRFYCVYDSARACELIYNLIKVNLQPKTMFFTQNGKGKSVLVVIEAVKGGKSGVKVLENLVTNDKDGKYLEKLHTKNFQ